MATFQVQVEDLTGTIGDTTAITSWLTDGAKEIINILPANKKALAASTNTLNNSSPTLTINGGDVLDVTRSDGTIDRPCRIVSPLLRGKMQDTADINYVTKSDPVYYILNNTLTVYPTPTASETASVSKVAYPAVAYGDSAISVFPDDYEYLVVLYASLKGLQRLMNDKSSDLPSDITLPSLPVAPSVPSISDLSISNAVPSVPSLTSNSVSFSTGAPNYTKPTLAMASAPTISDLNINVVPPSVPSDPSFSAGAISVSSSAPTYSKPSLAMGVAPTISNLTIGVVPPSIPSDPSFSAGAISMSGASAPTYTKPTFAAPALGTIGSMNLPVAPSAPSDPSYTTPDISSVTVTDTVIGAMPTIESTTIANLGTAPTYTAPNIPTGDSPANSTSTDITAWDNSTWTDLDYDLSLIHI